MTALDDALNSSAPLFDPVEIIANWEELPGYVAGESAVDDLRDLGQQIGPQGYTVEHSFDDGLPDPVTMTATNNASGKLVADLVGRQANMADAWGWRTTTSGGTGSSDTISCTPPGDVVAGDYVIVAIAANTATALTDASPLVGTVEGWSYLGSYADGALTVWLWGNTHYTGAPAFTGWFAASTAYSWVAGAAWARTAAGSVVPIGPGTVVGAAEAASTTAHAAPEASVDRNGWVVGVWASVAASAQWTVTGTDTEIHETAATTDIMMSRSTYRLQGERVTLTANTTGATAVAVKVAIPLAILSRERMDARQYFSPFNTDSPIAPFERDTAPVTLAQPVVTADGVVSTNIFTGRMAGTDIKERLAELLAYSQTRIDMDRSLVLPLVYGWREGCTVDWLAAYLMACGGQYVGVAPSPQTRVWVPFYGSVHPFLDGNFGYPRGHRWVNAVMTDWRPPTVVEGPFVRGMYGQQLTAETLGTRVQFDDQPPLEGIPGQVGEFNDYFSQQNNRGRMTVWLRGDVAVNNPTSISGLAADNYLFEYKVENRSTYNVGSINLGGLEVRVLPSGQVRLRMGSNLDGYAQLDLTPTFLPQDGQWHFLGVTWDWDAGLIDVRLDNSTWNTSAWTTTLSVLPASDAALRASGGYLQQSVFAHIPISEFQVETGPTMMTEGFTRFWPTPTGESLNATFRPTDQPLEVIADATPVQGWDALAALARSTLAHYRTNEEDNAEFLPLGYFGEPAQMTPTVIADTEVNAGELDVVVDPSKTRNVVTLEYNEIKVDSKLSPVLEVTSPIEIPRGITYFVFPLDVPAAEIQGALLPYGNDPNQYFNVWKLWQSEIDAPATIPNWFNFMTLNTKADGTGVNWDKTTASARIVDTTVSTVTIRFTNGGSAPLYLANNGTDVPFIRVLGYAIRSNPAYTTARDYGSIGKRRERALTSEMDWIQSREVAETVANKLVTLLARPREEVRVRVLGDPRRRPGQMVTLADAEGTRAAGNWRILNVTHRGAGAMYTQDLKLVRVLPIGVWDGADGWDNASWGE
jgi:hypothetical protein